MEISTLERKRMVYFLQGMETGKVKVGITQNLKGRLSAYRTHVSEPIRVLAVLETWDDADFERRVLGEYKDHITHGEWFVPPGNFPTTIAGWRALYGVTTVPDRLDFSQAEELEFGVDPDNPATVTLNGEPACEFSHPRIALAYANHMNEASSEFSGLIFSAWDNITHEARLKESRDTGINIWRAEGILW